MTREEAKEAASVMLAWSDGKTIECKRKVCSEWKHDSDGTDALVWDWSMFDYRIKPEPKLRPWTEDEVPLGAIIRYKNNSRSIRLLIVCNDAHGLTGNGSHWPYNVLLENTEHSIDGGKTWLPCGVEEAK